MKEKTETPKRRGRAPSPLSCAKPGVGMAYVGKTKDDKGKIIHVRIGTTCARDTSEKHDGELQGAQLANFSGVTGKGLGEKYFTAKLSRKGAFTYLLFLCSAHHKKTMGAEVKADDLKRENIEATISRIMGKVKKEVGANKEGLVVINGFIDGTLDYEWLDLPWKQAKAEGMKLYETNKNGVFEEIGEKKVTKKPEPKKKTTAKKTIAKKDTAKKTSAKKKSAAAEAKESGAAKKPVKKKDNRTSFYGIKDGKPVTKRSAKKPEGYYTSKADRDAALAAIKGEDAPAPAPEVENTEVAAQEATAAE